MDGETLQNKPIFEMELEEVAKYYNDDENNYDLDDLDIQIWDSIGKFANVWAHERIIIHICAVSKT